MELNVANCPARDRRPDRVVAYPAAACLSGGFNGALVLGGHSWVELPIEHPLFHCLFDLPAPMNKLQSPSIHFWQRNYNPADPTAVLSAPRGPGSEDMHVRAWLDDRKRIVILATFNCDDGDGWEREGENEDYFRLFSEKRAYPLAINTLFYLMTH